MIPVKGSIKNYHWGMIGSDSYIAKFREIAQGLPEADVTSENKHRINGSAEPLAELWLGAHPSGPATLLVGKQYVRLDSFLIKEPNMVGDIELYHKHNKTLPFIFKILSVAQPLSLQAHPDKRLAEILHKKDPKNYPDSNHKPELAIALTEFEMLCDFRPAKEIVNFMKHLIPLRDLVGLENYERYSRSLASNEGPEQLKVHLARCFKALMICRKDAILKASRDLMSSPKTSSVVDMSLLKAISVMDRLYPGDPGIFAPFFLNYMKLKPGQAVYLKANKLHAYLSGECIECMACSDNVVRAGLTSKFRDVETLTNMLDYETVTEAHDVLIQGSKSQGNPSTITFAPTDEFKVDKVVVTPETLPDGQFTLPAVSSGSFFVVMSGKATARSFFNYSIEHKLVLGSAGFIPPKVSLRLYNIRETLTIYRSYC